MRTPRLALVLLTSALTLSALAPKPRTGGLVLSSKQAKAIAEQETGGRAISARRVPLNGASGGWEVDVRMPNEDRGWRCVIDADTRMVHSKTRIDQPVLKGKGGAILIKGTR
jgi:Peptidase propeptide and YPEB domain